MVTTRKGTKNGQSLAERMTSIRDVVQRINEPQALDVNTQHLQDMGGVEAVLELLGTDPDHGVEDTTVEERREMFGSNLLPSTPRKTFWQLFVDTFDDATLQILIVAAIVSLIIGIYDDPATGYVEGVAILTACLIVSVVTALNDYQKESQFRELSAANDDIDVVVVRSGKFKSIPVGEIVVGDLVCLEAGDAIPCDGVLVNYDGLEVDESALTGEPEEINKDAETDPFLLSGCTAIAGSGRFVAIAVGKNSQWGVIKSHLEKEQDATPLQEKLDDMAAMIGYVGMAAAAATFVAMMCIKIFVDPGYLKDVSVFKHALDAFIIGVTIVVVAVPEGLPLAVTISLAYSTKQMLKDQNLIRHLAACETMGNATNICSDKTGTLTENRMTVVRGIFANVRDNVCKKPLKISPAAREIILEGFACCSTAKILPPPPHKKDEINFDSRPQLVGSKTEAAMLLLARSDWGSKDDTDKRREEANFGKEGGSRLFPFSSIRKRMTVLVNKGESNWTMYHKGAAELILENCTMYTDIDGNEQPMTSEKRKFFEDVIQEFAGDALRCIAMCHRNNVNKLVKNIADITLSQCEQKLEKEMCLDALVGIADPLRSDVVDAVATCQRAGIFVRMVTGDNLQTARAIAKQAGILTEGGLSMTGEEFRKLSPAKLDEILPKLQVLARSSPEDKHILVQRLNGGLIPETREEWEEAHPNRDYDKERDLLLPGYKEEWEKSRGGVGEVVGVTGDGTNDGPALKAADVGLSMGLSGTDVAKNASDIIIMDDKFSSIVRAVLWGRSVFDNIRKFLQFQLTVNVVALTITFLSALVGYDPPLNAVMMLWVNLIMDTMGALALGTEPPQMELLDRRPYKRDASLISLPMWRNILIQATYQLGLLVYLLNKGPKLYNCEDGSIHHFTIIFNAFVFCQVFNEFNAREIGDRFDPMGALGKSPMFLMVIAFTVLAQWSIVEYGGDFTQTTPLTLEEWRTTVGYGAMSIPIGFIMRLVPVSEDPASFAGVPGKLWVEKKPNHWLGALMVALIPFLAAIVYQLAWEVEELKH
ncbi:plasma-membrane calcium-translocating P-type ATPase [Nitzschia inconspicua]|uniref:Calcium-transporting ATPase n=1 Tax=Nitzschia inconspicua TaxID=303405 RepID=A0A9K3LFP7_9STRA|nr:plasma-membrane calcium-translocating P-type ATPase [Nitzschia inconspicua]